MGSETAPGNAEGNFKRRKTGTQESESAVAIDGKCEYLHLEIES